MRLMVKENRTEGLLSLSNGSARRSSGRRREVYTVYGFEAIQTTCISDVFQGDKIPETAIAKGWICWIIQKKSKASSQTLAMYCLFDWDGRRRTA